MPNKVKKTDKTVCLFVLILVCLLNINGCNFNNTDNDTIKINEITAGDTIETNETPDEEHGPIYHEDGTVELGIGYTAFGFYDLKTGNIIDNGSLYIPKDNKITGAVSFQQNFEEKRNYLLITMIDYVQQNFNINGKSYKNYHFSLLGEAEINLDIEIENLHINAKEFTYLIIPEPDANKFINNEGFDWDVMFSTRASLIYRISLQENYETLIDNFDTDFELISEPTALSGFELTKSHKEKIPVVGAKSGDKVELVLLNENANEETYMLIGFLGWEQVAFEDGSKIKLIKLPEDSSIYYTLKLPDTPHEKVFQLFALEKPYVTLQNDNIYQGRTTFRVLLHNN